MNGETKRMLDEVADPVVQQTMGHLAPHDGAMQSSTIAYQPGSRERYTLTRLHAKGGIGQIWLARDGDLGREVALKELRPERADHADASARFLEEARITGQLEHPGIVPVYELSRRSENQKPFYTMRFVKGRTLAEAIRVYHRKREDGQAGPLDLRERRDRQGADCVVARARMVDDSAGQINDKVIIRAGQDGLGNAFRRAGSTKDQLPGLSQL